VPKSLFQQVWPYARLAVAYVASKFNLSDGSAENLVNEVLASLLMKRPDDLKNPKRYLLRTCRWRALEMYRNRKRCEEAQAICQLEEKYIPNAPEVLVALEDEDKLRFFGKVPPAQPEVPKPVQDGHSLVEISANFELPTSSVRMRLHLARNAFTHKAS